ncbi:hypothetical protein UlMin_006799 [Ulmus minor]
MRRIRAILSIVLAKHLNKPIPTYFVASISSALELRPCANQYLSLGLLNSFHVLPFSSSVSPYSKNESSDAQVMQLDQNVAFDDNDDNDEDENSGYEVIDEDGLSDIKQLDSNRDEGLSRDINALVHMLRDEPSCTERKRKLEQCGITVSSEMVVQVLSQVRNDWEAAFMFFLWAGKQPGYAHSMREYHSIISILGKMRKFDTAWALIDEMKKGMDGPTLVTPQTLLIMIRKYCAVHDVARAINTFYAFKRFKFDVGMEDFQGLLSALCRYKNVQDAEHLLFCNGHIFPFNTKSFNIILNGWCNVIVSPREANKIWWEMSKRGVQHDVISYACIISCYSKTSNLHKVLKLFDRMKKVGIVPDRKVYNAVVHALAKGKLVKEAINLMRSMEENGITPNAVTYNSLIKPLCKAQKIDEAREVFDEMLQRGLSPTVQTYHGFFRVLRTGEEVFTLLEKMKNTGCKPNTDTYLMLIRKFCRWRQLDNVFKLWNEINISGGCPDRSSYIVLIHGLFLNGKLQEAYKYYMEMKEKQHLPEPKTEEMLQAWMSGKFQIADEERQPCHSEPHREVRGSKKYDQKRDFLREPETRRVVRDRGFSFWEN